MGITGIKRDLFYLNAFRGEGNLKGQGKGFGVKLSVSCIG